MASWEETMPKKDAVKLRPEYIGFDRELVLTIDRVMAEERDYGSGPETKYVVYWKEGILGVCHPQTIARLGFELNVTQRNKLKALFGTEQEDCFGQRVCLTIDVGTMKDGKKYQTIVIQRARPSQLPNPWLTDRYGDILDPASYVDPMSVPRPQQQWAGFDAAGDAAHAPQAQQPVQQPAQQPAQQPVQAQQAPTATESANGTGDASWDFAQKQPWEQHQATIEQSANTPLG